MRLLVSSVRCCCGSDPLKSGSEQRLCPRLCLLCSCKPARSANTVCVFLFYFCCPSVCSLKERSADPAAALRLGPLGHLHAF